MVMGGFLISSPRSLQVTYRICETRSMPFACVHPDPGRVTGRSDFERFWVKQKRILRLPPPRSAPRAKADPSLTTPALCPKEQKRSLGAPEENARGPVRSG